MKRFVFLSFLLLGSCAFFVNKALEDFCGDGKVTRDEVCDDGNLNDDDECNTSCQENKPAICGNAIVEVGEQCDDGGTCSDNLSVSCNKDTDCKAPSAQCRPRSDDSCSSVCKKEVCGDGIKNNGDLCDDGNTITGDGCSSICERELCGDGIIQPDLDEECDDGNLDNEDECSASCKDEFCGDGIVQPDLGEECDDGGFCELSSDNCTSDSDCDSDIFCLPADGDGCSEDCEIEF
jgi:cysteine-rich repeat protein